MTGLRAEVWTVAIDETDPGMLLTALAAAGPSEAMAAAQVAHGYDRRRKVVHFALRLLLGRWVGHDLAWRPFHRDPLGRPSLAVDGQTGDASSALPDFSLAHAAGMGLVAIVAEGRVGIDVEAPRPIRMSEARQSRIRAAAETVSGRPTHPTETADAALLRAWVRLEAAAKATGEGMARLLTRHHAAGTDEDREALARLAPPARLVLTDLALPSPYVGAIALTSAASPPPVRSFPMTERDIRCLIAEPVA